MPADLDSIAITNVRLSDQDWMARAMKLARRGEGLVEPNPMVGCVMVRDGNCIGEGFHRRFGGAHAEVEALQSVSTATLAAGATAYVTLEPCCHTGKTPPCVDALIAAGLKRVVIAMRDPFSQVSGGGIERLRGAGIETVVGVLREAAESLNAPYLKRLSRNRPWVIAKWAMSLDGCIATVTGDSQWISGEVSRGEVHRLRGRVDAIVVGGGTAASDDPTLTARPPGPRTALRVVVAGRRLPALESNLMRTLATAPVLIAALQGADEAQLVMLERHGAEVFRATSGDRAAAVGDLLDELGRRELTNVLVEGGAALLASFAAIDELDEIHAYVAAKLLGGEQAPGPVGGMGFAKLLDTPAYRLVETARFDNDVRIIVRRNR